MGFEIDDEDGDDYDEENVVAMEFNCLEQTREKKCRAMDLNNPPSEIDRHQLKGNLWTKAITNQVNPVSQKKRLRRLRL